MLYVCLFKQKTAYEMRISDWSSDVCSSDLPGDRQDGGRAPGRRRNGAHRFALTRRRVDAAHHRMARQKGRQVRAHADRPHAGPAAAVRDAEGLVQVHVRDVGADLGRLARSEEHTSELQSLMRISYAVFCLKKKKNTS